MSEVNRGAYIALIGGECLGKTTQARLLVEELGRRLPYRKVMYTREPGGGTEVSNEIRELLTGLRFGPQILPTCSMLLFAAARAQDMEALFLPFLLAGGILVGDRCLWDSIAHQGFGEGLNAGDIENVNRIALKDRVPDMTILIDAPVSLTLERLAKKQRRDAIELKGGIYHERVANGYVFMARRYGFEVVDGTKSIEEIHAQILSLVLPLVGKLPD